MGPPSSQAPLWCGMANRKIERRQNPRAYIEAPSLVTPSSEKSPAVYTTIRDISLGGIGVKIESPSKIAEIPQKGKKVNFTTRADYFKFGGEGEVVWISSSWNIVGIKFTRLSEDSKRDLEELLRLFPSFSLNIH